MAHYDLPTPTLEEEVTQLEELLDWARDGKCIIQICWHHFRVDGPPFRGGRTQVQRQAKPEESSLEVLTAILHTCRKEYTALVKRTEAAELEAIAERNATEERDGKRRRKR